MEAFRTERGKSLAETLIVLALIAVGAGLAGPTYFAMTARAQTRSATADIASELRLARQLAMTRRERLRVVFDRTQQTITLQRADAPGVLETYRYGDKNVVVEEPTAGPDVLFHPSGRSATATTILVRGKGGLMMKVTVSLTGRVAIS